MCMGGCGGKSPSKSGNAYTPKKAGGSGKAAKGSYTPRGRSSVMSSFGKPSIGKVSFSGRK